MKVAAIARHPRAPRPFTLVLGTDEIASAIATKLTEATFAVVMSHDAFPPVMRRGMSFHGSLFDELCEVDGVVGERADTLREIARIHAEPHKVAVTEMHLTEIMGLRSPLVIVDSRMQKHRVTPDLRGVARFTVGVGPRFEVGINCDIAIETHPVETGAIVSRGITKMADGRAASSAVWDASGSLIQTATVSGTHRSILAPRCTKASSLVLSATSRYGHQSMECYAALCGTARACQLA
nr:hypothetical protein [Bradyrhizobium cenepequi]